MTITDIIPQKHRPNRSSVFVDGAFVFGMSHDDLSRYTLSVGMEITRERLNYLLDQVVFIKARDTALHFLASRPRTRHEITERLNTEGYLSDVTERVLALMEKYRYIDDAQYAQDYMESRLRQGNYGPYRIKQELKMKGISNELIEDAFRQMESEYGEAAVAREWLQKKRYDTRNTDYAQKKRCTDALIRRGFSYTAIRQAFKLLDEALNDEEFDDENEYEYEDEQHPYEMYDNQDEYIDSP